MQNNANRIDKEEINTDWHNAQMKEIKKLLSMKFNCFYLKD